MNVEFKSGNISTFKNKNYFLNKEDDKIHYIDAENIDWVVNVVD